MPRALLVVLFIAVVLRGGVLWFQRDNLNADPDGYRVLAQNIWRDATLGYQGRPTAFRPPLYPLLLSPVWALGGTTGVAIAHLFLGVATVALAFQLARQAGLERLAWLTALLVAVDPILLAQSTVVMTETLATFLATLAIYALTRASARSPIAYAIAGGCVGLAALTRPTFLLWGAMIFCAVLLAMGPIKLRVTRSVAYALGVLIVLAPWVVRNRLAFGEWIAGTTHGGYTLLLANNPEFYSHVRGQWQAENEHPPWDARDFNERVTPQLRRRTPAEELASNRRAYDMAWENIRAAPADFAVSCLARTLSLWNLMPHSRHHAEEPTRSLAARCAVGAFYAIEFIFALLALFRLPLARPPWLWIVLLALALTATHAVYWSDMRMRSVVMPGIALLATAACQRVFRPSTACASAPVPST